MLIRAEDPEHRGALTPEDGDTITTAATVALEKRIPIVLLLASSGADANHGVAALDGWGRAARVLAKASGIVPILAGVTGPAVSGTALLIGLADIVVMADEAYAFVSGPVPVQQMSRNSEVPPFTTETQGPRAWSYRTTMFFPPLATYSAFSHLPTMKNHHFNRQRTQ